ncbi:hypothetical protein [Streptomyces sp. NPDC058371]|uniref:hypothetical protein n=1 Tax=Streptomyces sp. NPDC058371 TaxID=3346463 RepID=UPI003663AB10
MAGALVATGGFFWLYGANDRDLDRACGGMLSVPDVRAVLGDDHLDVSDESGEGVDTCTVNGAGSDGGELRVSIVDTTNAGRPQKDLLPSLPNAGDDTLPVPVGHGWSGVLGADASDEREATATLLLTCDRRGAKSAVPDGLLITVETKHDAPLDDPANRPGYVRVATGTAKEAATAYGCRADLGRPVHTVGLPVTEEEFEPLAGVTGTCAGVPGYAGAVAAAGGSAAAGAVVGGTARETARDGAPRETCLLGEDGTGAERYTLDAYYGPYAAEVWADWRELEGRGYGDAPADASAGKLDMHGTDTGVWASAQCPGDGEDAKDRQAGGRAIYTLNRSRGSGTERAAPTAAERRYEKRALKAFAERSARSHGCAAPTTP